MPPRRPLVFGAVAWGEPVGQGAYDARYCTLGGVFKVDDDPEASSTIVNEYVCNRLALALGLPTPPGGFLRTKDSSVGFVSLRFGSLSEAPPPVVPATFVTDNPEIAAGIVVFDCWIANADRHAGNLAYRKSAIPPAIFDHGLALGGESRAGISELYKRIEQPAPDHCLFPHVRDADLVDSWRRVVAGLPRPIVAGIVNDVVGVGLLSKAEGDSIAHFLLARRIHMYELLRAKMTWIGSWGLGL